MAPSLQNIGVLHMKTSLLAAVLLSLTTPSLAAAQALQGLPPGPLGQAIQRGHDMMMNSTASAEAKPYIGNALSCSSCHINAGDTTAPGNLNDSASKFPAYSAREGAVITLEDRIANCFMRSMNGMRPGTDNPVVVDMTAYINWLDKGKPVGTPPAPPAKPSPYPAMLKAAIPADVTAGATLFKGNCAACHGADGGGLGGFPPLWGPKSYNAGAGLANIVKLAGWVKGNMPLGNPYFTPQQAFQVALYIDTRPRPDFVLSKHLPVGEPSDDYNANVHAETDTVASNLKKAGLSLQNLTSGR